MCIYNEKLIQVRNLSWQSMINIFCVILASHYRRSGAYPLHIITFQHVNKLRYSIIYTCLLLINKFRVVSCQFITKIAVTWYIFYYHVNINKFQKMSFPNNILILCDVYIYIWCKTQFQSDLMPIFSRYTHVYFLVFALSS